MAKKKSLKFFSIFAGCLMALSQILPAATPVVYAEENKPVLSVNVKGDGEISIASNTDTYTVTQASPMHAEFTEGTNLTFKASDGKEITSISEDGAVTSAYDVVDNKSFSYVTKSKDATLDIQLSDKNEGVASKEDNSQVLTTPSGMTENEIQKAKDALTDGENNTLSDDDKAMLEEYHKGNYNKEGYVKARLARGKKLGLEKYLDEDGFLEYSFFASNDFGTRRKGLDILIKWNSDGSYTVTAKKSTIKRARSRIMATSLDGDASQWYVDSVTLFDFHASQGNINNGEFIIKNRQTGQTLTGLCGDGWAAAPIVGQGLGAPMTAAAAVAEHAAAKQQYPSQIWAAGNTNWLIRASYYGYGGPGYQTWKSAVVNYWASQGHAGNVQLFSNDAYLGIISNAIVSDALGNYTSNPELLWTSGAFEDYYNGNRRTAWRIMMNNLPAPPDDFECYVFPNTLTASAGEGHYYGAHTRQPAVAGYYNPTGNLKIQKSSANASITDGNGAYGSMAGATYGLFKDATAKDNQVGTFTLKADGTSNTIEGLKKGNYYIRELTPPDGYTLDTTVYPAEVLSGKTVTKTFTDAPIVAPDIQIQKQDALTGQNKPQGDATFTDARYKVSYYDTYSDTDPGAVNKTAKRVWFMKADTNGKILMQEDYKVSGDDFYMNEGKIAMPLGTYTIQEIKAPSGYKVNKEVKVVQITAQNYGSVPTQVSKETPYLGKFALHKSITDGEDSSDTRDEAGAEFTAVLKKYYTQAGNDFDKAVKLAKENGTKYEWAVVKTDDHGDCKSTDLVFGEYVLKQTKLGETEVKEFDDVFFFVVTNNGENVYTYGKLKDGREITPSSDGLVHYYINNIPVKASLKIMKKETGTDKVIALNNTAFQIKMLDANEKPVKNYSKKTIKTDETGLISMKSAGKWYDTFYTNAQNRLSIFDKVQLAGKNIYEASSNEERGSVTLPVQLPVGNYELCEFNPPKGYLLDTTPKKFKVSRSTITGEDEDGELYISSVALDLAPTGDVKLHKTFKGTNKGPHGSVKFDLIATMDIRDASTGEYFYRAGDKVGTYDLGYEYVYKGTRLVKTTKIDKATDINVKNLPMGEGESSYKFVEVSTYENYVLDQKEYPVRFVQKDNKTPSYSNTVEVENVPIEIHTTATNAAVKDGKQANSAVEVELKDTVKYSGVVVGRELTMVATLMDKTTGQPVKDASGKTVTGKTVFTPTSREGTVDVKLLFRASDLGGHDVVVFESLLNTGLAGHENCEIATHKDLNDEGQTVKILDSKIHTTAKSENGTHEQQVKKDNKYSLVDTVKYEGLVPGQTYKLTGVLMDKETSTALTDIDKKDIERTVEFTPETSDGTIDVPFEFEKDDFKANQTLVVFETLTVKERGLEIEVANHKDIDDEGQSITLIDIHTTATSGNKTHEQGVTKNIVTIKDRVQYEGLKPGKEYTINGTLVDKKTGKPIVARMAEVETVKGEDKDKDETTDSTTDESTKNDTETKDNTTESDNKDNTTEDSKNDTDGEDKADDESGTKITYVLKDKEEEVKSSVTFTPEKADGYVDVWFAFDGSVLYGGEDVVAFESLEREKIEVATHADIEDEGQTVTIVEIHTLATVNNKKKTYSEGTIKLKDTVSYKGLKPGTSYELTGTLMSKKTGKAFTVNGKELVSKTKFTPEKYEGKVDVNFEFDAKDVKNAELVVFEDLVNLDTETKVTDHKDINDKDQTVVIEEKPETGIGDSNHTMLWVTFTGISIMALFMIMLISRRFN